MAQARSARVTKRQPRPVIEVPLEDFNESKNILIHSWPGQGKTVFGAMTPNSTLFSAEPGSISAKRQGATSGLVKIPDWDTANDVLAAVENGEFCHRDWITIDTLSTLQQKHMNQTLDRAVEVNPTRDPDIPAIQDYQKNQGALKRWVERMVDAPINCLFLAHTMQVDYPDGSSWFIPSIQGGADKGYPVSNYIMGQMNVVGYMEIRTVKDGTGTKEVRRTLWQPYHDLARDIRYTAKDQFDCLGRFSDDISMAEVIRKIEASGEPVPSKKKSKKSKG